MACALIFVRRLNLAHPKFGVTLSWFTVANKFPIQTSAQMERYKVLDMIGEGSFGRVYRGRLRYTGHTVALKEYWNLNNYIIDLLFHSYLTFCYSQGPCLGDQLKINFCA